MYNIIILQSAGEVLCNFEGKASDILAVKQIETTRKIQRDVKSSLSDTCDRFDFVFYYCSDLAQHTDDLFNRRSNADRGNAAVYGWR